MTYISDRGLDEPKKVRLFVTGLVIRGWQRQTCELALLSSDHVFVDVDDRERADVMLGEPP
jgi:hypothetical protein